MSRHIQTVDFQMGDANVLLRVEFTHTPGRPATGSTYACGGTPAEPEEFDIISLEWSRNNKKTKTYQWHAIEGPLFDFITEDGYLLSELGDLIESHAEEAAERRYEERAEARG